jgi:glutathione peroxidase
VEIADHQNQEWRPVMPENVPDSVYDIPLKRIDGQPATLDDYRGKVMLIVNVASKCGLTPQYEGLERLYEAKRDQGLEVLGFPCNDFRGQEPGSEAEIVEFCSTTYGVKFPLFGKLSVKGPEQHPLYRTLTAAPVGRTGDGAMRERLQGHGIEVGGADDVLWNFEKFLVGRNGEVLARFDPDITVDDPRVEDALDKALAQG